MKSVYRYRYMLFLFTAVVLAGILGACSDDDSGGEPVVSYVRVTDPSSSDSLLVSAGQGQMVVIMGRNLEDVRQLWFNDRRAGLNPSFITSTSVITRIPEEIPALITNKMKMIFANGDSLLYDFSVDIGEPQVDRMKSEYVNAGEVAVVYGNYFYEPLTVMFTGGVQAEIVSVEDDEIQFKVPEGVEAGPITIKSNFGETESSFWFRDNRNIIASFDNMAADGWWHGPQYVVSSDANIPSINGKFIRLNKELGAWEWFEMYVGNANVMTEFKNIPVDAFANPGSYSLKFEINTLKSLTGASMHLYIGPDMAGQRNDTNYNWQPNLHTEGQWQTVTIPWEDVYTANKEFQYNSAGYGVSIHWQGPSAASAVFGMDNLRVVPN